LAVDPRGRLVAGWAEGHLPGDAVAFHPGARGRIAASNAARSSSIMWRCCGAVARGCW
jgi:hypothetical protein